MRILSRLKTWFFALAVLLLVIGWLTLGTLTLYCTLSLVCDSDASSWWQLMITVFGVPVVIYQLYTLRGEIQKLSRRPKIKVGLMTSSFIEGRGRSKEYADHVTFDMSQFSETRFC